VLEGKSAGELAALEEEIEKLKGEAGEWRKLLGVAAP